MWSPGYSPWMQPPPPWWTPGCQQVPLPPGADPMKAMEFIDRMYRRAEKKKEKEESKKKDSKPKDNPFKDALWYFQAATILWFLSPFIGAAEHLLTKLLP